VKSLRSVGNKQENSILVAKTMQVKQKHSTSAADSASDIQIRESQALSVLKSVLTKMMDSLAWQLQD